MHQQRKGQVEEREWVLSQVGAHVNSLKSSFHGDIIYDNYITFKALGLGLEDLFKLEKKYPVLFPWNPEYDTYRNNVNRRFTAFPLVILMAKKKKDIKALLLWAEKYKIQVTLRGGAHSFEGLSLGTGLLIDQSLRTKIKVNKEKALVRVQPGCLLGPTANKIAESNFALPAGTSPNVGVVGISLGGGIGFLSRKYGLSSDNIKEVKLILASGESITANEKQHSDLYWAHRGGGGGNFGIVTSLVLQVVKLPTVYAFTFLYNFADFKPVLKAWENWAYQICPDFASEFHCYNGGQEVSVSGEYFGTDESLFYREMGLFVSMRPVSQTMEKVRYIDAVKLWGGSGHWRPFFKAKNSFVGRAFPDQAIDIMIDYISRGSGNDIFELTVMGGKVDEFRPEETAFPHRGVKSWLLLNTHWSDQAQSTQEMDWIRNFYRDLQPYLLPQVYVNGPDLELTDPFHKYYLSNFPRLQDIKRKYDPTNTFHSAQSIPL